MLFLLLCNILFKLISISKFVLDNKKLSFAFAFLHFKILLFPLLYFKILKNFRSVIFITCKSLFKSFVITWHNVLRTSLMIIMINYYRIIIDALRMAYSIVIQIDGSKNAIMVWKVMGTCQKVHFDNVILVKNFRKIHSN